MEEWGEGTDGRFLHVASNMYLGHFNILTSFVLSVQMSHNNIGLENYILVHVFNYSTISLPGQIPDLLKWETGHFNSTSWLVIFAKESREICARSKLDHLQAKRCEEHTYKKIIKQMADKDEIESELLKGDALSTTEYDPTIKKVLPSIDAHMATLANNLCLSQHNTETNIFGIYTWFNTNKSLYYIWESN